MTTILLFGFLILSFSIKILADEYVTTSSPENSTEQSVDVSAGTLFDEYWQMTLSVDPEFATFLSDHRYDDRLTEYSLRSYEERKVKMMEFLERATHLLALAPGESDTHENLQLFIITLQCKINKIVNRSYLFPLDVLYPPPLSLKALLYINEEEAKNYWDLISRFRAFPKQIDEQIELMREGIRTNFTLNEHSLWKQEGEQNHNVTESPFYKPFLNISSSVSTEEADHIRSNASEAVMNDIYPALKKLDDFMENEYRPNTRPEVGVGSLPGGQEYYRHELACHLTDQVVTAEEIHAAGVEEVRRIAEEMEEIIQSLGLNMTRQEFNNKLRADESNFFTSKEEVVETYRNVTTNVITPKLPLVFKNIPEKIIKFESSDVPSRTVAAYKTATPDNSTHGTVYLYTSSLDNFPRSHVMTLAMHEGVPGHHLESSYTQEQNDIPDFRKYGLEGTAFDEGWALYAEYLGYELGLYEDPYMRYGHLSGEILRACRMVVDTGMHMFGWSRQKAIDYLMNYTSDSLNITEMGVDRYISWPGQACSYKYGEMKIKQLRKRAESALGDDFDIKEFHDVILRNSGPFQLVEKKVDRYIESSNTIER